MDSETLEAEPSQTVFAKMTTMRIPHNNGVILEGRTNKPGEFEYLGHNPIANTLEWSPNHLEDETWTLERVKQWGDTTDGDLVFFRSRHGKFLSARDGERELILSPQGSIDEKFRLSCNDALFDPPFIHSGVPINVYTRKDKLVLSSRLWHVAHLNSVRHLLRIVSGINNTEGVLLTSQFPSTVRVVFQPDQYDGLQNVQCIDLNSGDAVKVKAINRYGAFLRLYASAPGNYLIGQQQVALGDSSPRLVLKPDGAIIAQ